jgi:general secretion pathway protein D
MKSHVLVSCCLNLFFRREVRSFVLFCFALSPLFMIDVAYGQNNDSGYKIYKLEHRKADEVEDSVLKLLIEYGNEVHVVADKRRNQILLKGPKSAHTKTLKLLKTLDKPLDQKPPVVKSYPVSKDNIKQMVDDLRIKYSNDKRIRIASNPQNAKIIVLAPLPVQKEIKEFIESLTITDENEPEDLQLILSDKKKNWKATSITDKQIKKPIELDISGNQPNKIVLKKMSTNDLTYRLRDILGQKLKADSSKNPAINHFQFISSKREITDLYFNKTNQSVEIEGNPKHVKQLLYLIRLIDNPPKDKNNRVAIVPLDQKQKIKVREAIRKYKERISRLKSSPENNIPDNNNVKSKNDRSELFQNNSDKIQLVQFQFVPATLVAQQVENNQPPGNNHQEESDELRELGGDVSIETLDDIDVIIIRGGDHDIKELTRIIREIEKLSEESKPEVFVYQLKHVASSSIAELTSTVSIDLVGNQHGRVNVISLNKPNAVLVVGWGEAFKTMKELIKQLDQPVNPNSEVHVFRLKHAPALSIQPTINTYLTNRGNRTGLATKALVIADSRSNSIIIKASPRDLAEVKSLIDNLDKAENETVQQVRIFKLENTLAADIAVTLRTSILSSTQGTAREPAASLEIFAIDTKQKKKIKSGLLNNVQITPDSRTNSLFVTAPSESMNLIAALIKQLDAKTTNVAQIKVFRIINGDAGELVRMLKALLPTQAGTRVTPQLTSAIGEGGLTPLRFAVDERTNSIIATGSRGELEIVEALLMRLDEDKVKQRQTEVYRLKNSPAVDVAQTVNDYLRSEQRLQQITDTGVNRFRQMEREVIVVAEKVSNSLVISATPKYFDDILKLVEDLDKQPAQVMIQVLIAEVSLNDMDEFGVELGLQDSILFDRSLLGDLVTTTNTSQGSTPAGIITSTQEIIQAATNTPGFGFNNQPLGNSGSTSSLSTANSLAGQALSSFAVGRLNPETGYGGLVLSASSENVSILVRALQESRRLEVLSRPQVMTLDNQEAFIQVGQRVPRIASSQQSAVGLINTIEMENVGLILQVRPRISPEGLVVMNIDAEKSELGPEAEGIPISTSTDGTVIRAPRINLTQASTTVSATSGETVVLGGLITKSTSDVHRRVPWLSDIPIVGNLFRYDSIASKRTELLIIMTPYVVRSSADAEMIKQVEASRMHWTASDVHEIHGDGAFCDQKDCPICNANIPVIYPDSNPRGIIPTENHEGNHQHHHHDQNLQPHKSEPENAPELIVPPEPKLNLLPNSQKTSATMPFFPRTFNQGNVKPINHIESERASVSPSLFDETVPSKERNQTRSRYPDKASPRKKSRAPDSSTANQQYKRKTGKWNPRKRIPWWKKSRE